MRDYQLLWNWTLLHQCNNTGEVLLQLLDYMGTVVFAMSGTLIAGSSGMDLLGGIYVGIISAIGGGTLRDILLGKLPIFWIQYPEYIWMSILTSILTFFFFRRQKIVTEEGLLLFWLDAIGLGAFGTIAARSALMAGINTPMLFVISMVTCSGGGIVRDILTKRPVRVLHNHAEVYAITSQFASLSYVLCYLFEVEESFSILTAVFFGTVGRFLAWYWDWRLPAMKNNSIAPMEEESARTKEITTEIVLPEEDSTLSTHLIFSKRSPTRHYQVHIH